MHSSTVCVNFILPNDTVAGVRLLTDIIMPQMNGHMLAEQVVMLRPGIQILYMSGYVEPPAFKRLHPQGDDHFLKKPFDIREVSRKVRALLDQC